MTTKAIEHARYSGADVKVLALAAIRATREAEAKKSGETLPCIVGYPLAGEKIGQRTFDGNEAFAIFPGDLPADPEEAMSGWETADSDVRFVRFRPPDAQPLPSGGFAPFPNIRLDRAEQMLSGDRLDDQGVTLMTKTARRKPTSFRVEDVEIVMPPEPARHSPMRRRRKRR